MTSEPIEFAAVDGYPLRGTLWSPDTAPRALVLIHPATAVPERLYAGFARFLTERGFAALTYNYRGIGASRPARLSALQARMRDWVELDVGAAIAGTGIDAGLRANFRYGQNISDTSVSAHLDLQF